MCDPGQAGSRGGSPAPPGPAWAARPTPSCADDAVAMAVAGLAWLARADAAGLAGDERARCLRGLEGAESALVAARSAVLSAFDAQRDFEADGHPSARAWLKWQARVTGAAAAGATGWARRLAAHQAVAAALAAGEVSASWARSICDWSDELPQDARPGADRILLAAAGAGAGLRDLAGLAQEIAARTARPDPGDGDGDGGFDDRSVRLALHFRGSGRLTGDLTPRCAAAVRAVLDSLGKKAGPEDTRTRAQRDHDALEEAMRRLIASGCLPDRAGQPVQIQLVMTLQDLLRNQGDQAGGTGGPGGTGAGASHDGASPWPPAAPGDDCDAAIAPIVTGHVDHDLLDRLATRLTSPGRKPGGTAPRPGQCPCGDPGCDGTRCDGTAIRAAYLSWASARALTLAEATALLSGPGGLASRLRTGTLTGPAGTISLPLDLGAVTDTIPPHLRRAVIHRDRHCAYPGGCYQPPAACQVHHLIPRSQGGPTKLTNLGLFCTFHHLILIHQWGWTMRLNPDGTMTATSPDGRIVRAHSPPPATAA